MMKCPKCGKEYASHPAISRIDNSAICPLCGAKEALDDAVKARMMSQVEADRMMNCLNSLKNE